MGIQDVIFTAMDMYKYKELGYVFAKVGGCNTYISTELTIGGVRVSVRESLLMEFGPH